MPSPRGARTWRPDMETEPTIRPERWIRANGPVPIGDLATSMVRALWAATHPDGEPFPDDLAGGGGERAA